MKKMGKTQTEQVLIFMKILAWIAFFGFAVAAGATLFIYTVSVWNPDAASHLYDGINLYDLRQTSLLKYSITMFLLILTNAMKAYVWWMVVKLINNLKISNPFTRIIAYNLAKISYTLFAIWILSVTAGGFFAWMGDIAGNLNANWKHGQFLFMACLVFIIFQIFKRGIEIQSENDLTV
ncbi:DUF2975 domain-containing protein [uncultured Draconibacterium sp.]|uniref:DUF2975 domain-containing protein n=1 Tax=uncultured Draconibacterium sp. TaxID=1573823 RepID=UPI0025FCC7CB|nr:DUF2975 domain-containing protein [uncultured Draconibacterium sp.]